MWHHIACTISNGIIVGYIDGRQSGDFGTYLNTGSFSNSAALYLAGQNSHPDIAMDDFRWYGMVFNAGQVRAIYDEALPTVTISAADDVATEAGATTATFMVRRGSRTSGALTVYYSIGGEATIGSDYTGLSGSVVIPNGQSSVALTVTPVDDMWREADERVIVTLAKAPTCAIGLGSSATVTITSDDTLPTVSVTAPHATAAEQGAKPGTFTVTRDEFAGALTVYYAVGGSATAGSDYSALSGAVVIADGQNSATITLTPVDDGSVESEETVVLTMSANATYGIGPRGAVTVTIADNDGKPTVSVLTTDAVATEAGTTTGAYTVSREDRIDGDLTVYYVFGGTAVSGRDYLPLAGSVVIPEGQTSAVIPVVPGDDDDVETDETVVLTLVSNADYTVGSSGSAVVTIRDDDVPSSLGLWLTFDDSSGVSKAYDSGLHGNDASVQWDWWTSNTASGSGNSIYLDGTSSARVLDDWSTDADSEATISMWIKASTQDSWDRLFTKGSQYGEGLELMSIGTADDIRLSIGTTAGGGHIDLNNVLNNTWHHIAFTLDNGTAKAYLDGHQVGGSASYAVGRGFGNSGADVVLGLAEGLYDDVRYYTEALSASEILNIYYATVGLPLPTVTITTTDATATEAGATIGTFTVSRGSQTSGALTVYYQASGTASSGSDYAPLSGSVVIPNGQTSATITVTPIDDSEVETDETVIVTLSMNSAYTVSLPCSGTVTIVNDDVGDTVPVITSVEVNGDPDASVSHISPAVGGVQTVIVTFSEPVNFSAAAVSVNKVAFPNGVEQLGDALAPLSVTGNGSAAMTIQFATGEIRDTWVRIVLHAAAVVDSADLALDGDPAPTGAGCAYLYEAATDLPSGDGAPGGDAVFYVGSLCGDFTGDGRLDTDDAPAFQAAYLGADLDADFCGRGFLPTGPDGLLTPEDVDGFSAVWQAQQAGGTMLDALPVPPIVLVDGDRFRVELRYLDSVGETGDLRAFELTAVAKDGYWVNTFTGSISGTLHQDQFVFRGTPRPSATDAWWADNGYDEPSELDSYFMLNGSDPISITAPTETGWTTPSGETSPYEEWDQQCGYGTSMSGEVALAGYSDTSWTFARLVAPVGSTLDLDFVIASLYGEQAVDTTIVIAA